MSAAIENAFELLLAGTGAASVLIVLTAAIHLAFRDRLKAAWRFFLWLPALARLLFPVFPESPASLFNAGRWFLEAPAETPMARGPVIAPPGKEVFPKANFSLEAVPASRSPANWRQIAAWLWVGGAALLLGRMAIGSIWLHRRLTGSPLGNEAETLLRELAEQAGIRPPRVQATSLIGSPALFGFWRPTLLVPHDFAQRLDRQALRHVFLHELAHLKRGDLWFNAAMNVALALHWFNPLAWLAVRQMRLEREMACDEAAIRASGGESAAYGQTLLLLLAGPRKPGLQAVAAVGVAEEKSAAERRLREIAAFGRRRVFRWILAPVALLLVCGGLTNAQQEPAQPGIFPDAPTPATTQPPNARARETMAISPASKPRKLIAEKLQRLTLPEFRISEPSPLTVVLRQLDRAVKSADPEGSGVNFIISSRLETQPGVDPVTGLPFENQRSEGVEDFIVTLEAGGQTQTQTVWQIIHRIADSARPPAAVDSTNRLAFTLEDYGVVFMRASAQPEPLYTRTFKIDPNLFLHGIELTELPEDPKSRSDSILERARRFFEAGGVTFEPAAVPGQLQKAMFYNDRTGVLFIRATLQDLDVVESMLQVIATVPPQVTFEVVAFETSDAGPAAPGARAAGIPSLTGILTEAQRRLVLRALEQSEKYRKVEFPRLTTLSGRPARSEVEGLGAVDMQAEVDGAVIGMRVSLAGQNRESAMAKVYDGQTLVLGGASDGLQTTFFVTVTIIDPAGNRVHHPENKPFDPNTIPPQK